jgi:hypothetical protein
MMISEYKHAIGVKGYGVVVMQGDEEMTVEIRWGMDRPIIARKRNQLIRICSSCSSHHADAEYDKFGRLMTSIGDAGDQKACI